MFEIIDPLVAAVAGALLNRAGEGVANAAASSWSRVTRLVAEKLGRQALPADDTDDDPDARQAELEKSLQLAVDADPAFRARLQSLWQQARIEITASGDSVHVAGNDLEVHYHLAPAAVAVAAPPRELPPSSSVFVNRLSEQARMDRVADSGTGTRMVVLRGMPGVGRSTLAVRWGSKRQDRFPGGQLYADYRLLRGDEWNAEAASLSALRGFLRSMGVPDGALTGNLATLTAQYRTLMSNRAQPVLVVVDGATEPAQVRALLPTVAGSMLVVSSDHDLGELAVDNAEFIDVEPLTIAEGVDLLTAVCGADRIAPAAHAARRLVTSCQGHTAALQVAAARLVLDPTFAVDELADAIAADPHGLAELTLPGRAGRTVRGSVVLLFDFTYQSLGDDARRLYRDLGALPVLRVTDDLLAHTGWDDPDLRQQALDELVGTRLLNRTTRRGYRQHPLLRAHAKHLAAVEQPRRNSILAAAAVEHLATRAWQAARAVMGDRLLLVEPPPDADDAPSTFTGPAGRRVALDWLENHRQDLLQALRHADDQRDDMSALRLAESLPALYLNHRHAAEWIESTELGVKAAVHKSRYDLVARLQSLVSRCHTDLGDIRRAREAIDAAVDALAQVSNPALTASVREFQGRLLSVIAPDEARAVFEDAIEANAAAGIARGIALCRFFLGAHLVDHDRATEGLPTLYQARDELNAVDDDRMSARADAAIGRALLRTGAPRRARTELHVAADFFAAEGLWHYEVPVRNDLADAYEAMGDAVTAQQHRDRATTIAELTGTATSPAR
ncbi:hypothetical protein [Actinoplanes sp. NPDC051859]|uniref:hypothetical protein n=1 Tax=Actinoplanes sp. NPDC051859 TaxID=3363909 RepID=UPI0037AC946A